MARRPKLVLPAEWVAQLVLAPGERLLAWASLAEGGWLAGSDRALHLHDGGGHRRLAWEAIERADWQRDSETLAIVEVADWGEPERRTALKLAETGQLLELLRERVTKSVLVKVYSPVRGRRGLSVVGRRSPTGSGDVLWSYVLAAGLDPADPEVARVAERTLEEAQRELAGL